MKTKSSLSPDLTSESGDKQTLSLLLIDKHPLAQQLIEKFLQENKHTTYLIKYAQSIEEGLQLLSKDTIDVCLIDYKLGKSANSLDSLKTIKNETSAIPIIVILPNDDPELERSALQMGATDILVRGQFSANVLDRSLRLAVERGKTQLLSHRAVQLQNLFTGISTSFIDCPPEQIDIGIEQALQLLSEFTGADRGFIVQFSDNQQDSLLQMTHEWHRPDIESAKDFYNSRTKELFSPLAQVIADAKIPFITKIEEIPPEAARLREVLKERKVGSLAVMLLQSWDQKIGFFGFATMNRAVVWDREMLSVLELAGQIFVNTLAYQRKDNQLRKSEKKFRSYFELPLIGIAISSVEGNWIEVNDRLCNLLGYSRAELVNTPWSKITHPNDLEKCIEAFQKAVSGETNAYSLDKRYIRKDGSLLYTKLSVGCVRDASNQLEYFVVLVSDISDRERAHEVLIEQQDYLRQIIDTIPHRLVAKDRNGRFILANQSFADGMGLALQDIIGKPMEEVGPDADEVERFRQEDQQVFNQGLTLRLNENPLTHTGKTNWFSTVKKPLRSVDGTIIQVLSISTDITEEKRSRDMLKALLEGTSSATAENFFRSLVYHLVSVLDCRSAFMSKLVTGKTDVAETICVYLDGRFLDNWTYTLDGTPSQTVIAKGMQYYPDSLQELFPEDPTIKDLGIQSYLAAPIFDSTGKPLGALGVMDNQAVPYWETAQWLLTIFAARAGAELERMLSEAETRSLQKQLRRSQKMEVIGQLAAGIAHDLNNSLGAVVGHLHLIKMQSESNPNIGRSSDIALSGCERASSLIEQLLGFSRHKKYNLEKASIAQLATQTIELLSSVISKKIIIETRGTAHELLVHADSDQLQQALANIILNACQAMPQGGTLTLDYSSRVISNAKHYNPSARPGSYVVLGISDTGTGITEEHLDKIFEPFFSTKEKGQGTGLGLPMAYQVLQDHAGWIEVSSQLEQGTTFTLYLPQVQRESTLPEDQSKDQVQPETQQEFFVVVIDDEKFLVELCETFLQKAGFQSAGFSDPAEALNWYQTNWGKTDLIILDLRMPGISGEECFDRIKMINPDAQVIVLTGFLQSDLQNKLLNKGALKFFSKTFKISRAYELDY